MTKAEDEEQAKNFHGTVGTFPHDDTRPRSAVEAVLNEIVQEPAGDNVVPITRQQRRAAEREAAKVPEPLISITEAQYGKLMRARIMLAALVKREGRVRLTQRELNGIGKRAKLDVKVAENGDVVMTFVEG